MHKAFGKEELKWSLIFRTWPREDRQDRSSELNDVTGNPLPHHW